MDVQDFTLWILEVHCKVISNESQAVDGSGTIPETDAMLFCFMAKETCVSHLSEISLADSHTAKLNLQGRTSSDICSCVPVCVVGYQRELTYKHDDGSYSAFGKNDESGNTWSVNLLTALVMFASDTDTTDRVGPYGRKQILHSLVLWMYIYTYFKQLFSHISACTKEKKYILKYKEIYEYTNK